MTCCDEYAPVPRRRDGPDPWTVKLLDLPPELQISIFFSLVNMRSVIDFRLTCRQLDATYRRIAPQLLIDQRDRLVKPFARFYEFLMRLKLPEGSLRYPPPGGWPNIDPENVYGSDTYRAKKTPFAVEILRHLPYIYTKDEEWLYGYDTSIGYMSTACDYSRPMLHDANGTEADYVKDSFHVDDHVYNDPPMPRPPHVLLMAYGWEPGGVVLFLDTLNGLIIEDEATSSAGYAISSIGYPRPPPWRYFNDRITALTRLDQVFVSGQDLQIVGGRRFWWTPGGDDDDYNDDYDGEEMERRGEPPEDLRDRFGGAEDAEWVRHLHYKHGWPGEKWDKKACLEAIDRYVGRRFAF